MANPDHVAILKQGIAAWNAWRKEHPEAKPDLSSTDLNQANLSSANLRGTDLVRADLNQADLSGANLSESNLGLANLSGANLTEASLYVANLEDANLTDCDCSRANLRYAKFIGTRLVRARLEEATLSATVFANVALLGVKGLETCDHAGPSLIDHRTLQENPNLSLHFLRGCGLGDLEIEFYRLYKPQVSNQEITDITYRIYDLRAHQSIQINPLFISYSRADSDFVDYLEPYLTDKGIRFWRDVHHTVAGRLEIQIDRAMRLHPTVLLIFSRHSVDSDWVEHEARLARLLEKEMKRDVICPIALDGAWKTSSWPSRLREQIMEYNILDFSNWKDKKQFERMFSRLIDGLDLFY